MHLRVSLLALAVCVVRVALAAPDEFRPHPWSPETYDALRLYQRGDYKAARELALAISQEAKHEAVRRDAAAIDTLTMLHSPSRSERLDARERLLGLAVDAPTLRLDPECNLALGIAQTAVFETADALDRLDRTVSAFRALGLNDRLCEALVAYAAAWAAHTEWELTVGRLLDRQPRDAAEADAIRIARIRAILSAAGALPGSTACAARISVVLATRLIQRDETRAEGRATLARLAGETPLVGPGGEAALVLAELLEKDGDVAGALSLYERLARDGSRDQQLKAETRIEALRRPELLIDAPRSLPDADALTIDIRARSLRRVRLELREVDLDSWLAKAQARGVEASLPEAGRVLESVDLATTAIAAGAPWASAEHGQSLRLDPPAGAYVIVARGSTPDARELTVKQLVLITDLEAACVIGSSRAAVWVTQAGAPAREGTVQFWMQRSFMPTEAAIAGGVAQLALPGEAAQMRERGWLCLVRVGAHVTLCRGTLPGQTARGPAENQPALLVAGPAAALPDQPLEIAGLWWRAGRTTAAGSRAELRVVDTMNDVVATAPLEPGLLGVISASVRPGFERVGRHFRVTLHDETGVVENRTGRLALEVIDRDPHRLALSVEGPTWPDPNAGTMLARLSAARPWGAPLGGQVLWRLEGAALPESIGAAAPATPSSGRAELTPAGLARIEALSEGVVSGRPFLAELSIAAGSTDGSSGQVRRSALRSSADSHVWLEPGPNAPMAGQVTTLRLGAYFPAGWPLTKPPRLRIEGPGGDADVWVFSSGVAGLEVRGWAPILPGRHDWTIESAPQDSACGERLSAAGWLDVAPADEAGSVVTCRALLARDSDVEVARVMLRGQSGEPLLVIVENGDVLGAQCIALLQGRMELAVRLAAAAPGAAIRVIDRSGRQVASCMAERAEEVRPEVSIEPLCSKAWPGETATVDVLLNRVPAGSALIARLISSSEVGSLGSATAPASARRITVSTSANGADACELPSPAELDWPRGVLANLFLEGETLWCRAVEVDEERAELSIPLPDYAGRFHLLATVLTPDGAIGSAAGILDTRAGVDIELSVPVQFEINDRTCLGVQMQNHSSGEQHVELEVDFEGPLTPRACTGLSDAAWRALRDERRPAKLALPPGNTWLRIDVAAAEPGAGRVRVIARGDGGETAAQAAFTIRSPQESTSGEPPLGIRRTVSIWTPPDAASVTFALPPSGRPRSVVQPFADAGWTMRLWTPGTSLKLGEVIHVLETFSTEGARPPVAWRQRVPATCMAWPAVEGLQRLVGTPALTRDQTLEFRTEPIAAGTHEHEYLLGVSRPGECRLPWPELELVGRPLRVAMAPEEVSFIVSSDSAVGGRAGD